MGSTLLPVLLLLLPTVILAQSSACPDRCTCHPDTVTCTNQQLTLIPKDIPQKTKFLYLDYNRITTVSVESLSRLNDLQALSISNNRLSHIQNDSFQDTHNLVELDFSFNLLVHQSISNSVFSNLTKLCVLNLAHNDLGPTAPQLVLSPEEGRFSLNLSNNSLMKIQENSFINLKHIITLDLSYNLFSAVSNPKSFEGLQTLTTLILSHNNIEYVMLDGLAPAEKLQTLLLDHNKINKLPNLIRNTELLEIDCSHNNIYWLQPEDYIYIQNSRLRTLRLSYNQITMSPSWNGTRTLHALYLDGNKIFQIDRGEPAQNVQLRILELSNQSDFIENIYEGDLDIFQHLEYLGLSWNNGAQFVGDVFAHVPQLKYLYLNHTHQNWQSGLFSLYGLGTKYGSDCPTLHLDISESQIPYLRGDVFSSFDWDVAGCNSIQIKLDNNPWNCGCSLSQYRHWYMKHSNKAPNLQCHTPKVYRKKWMSDLPDNVFSCEDVQKISSAVSIALGVLLFIILISSIVSCVVVPVGNIDYSSSTNQIDEHSPTGYGQPFPPAYGSINS